MKCQTYLAPTAHSCWYHFQSVWSVIIPVLVWLTAGIKQSILSQLSLKLLLFTWIVSVESGSIHFGKQCSTLSINISLEYGLPLCCEKVVISPEGPAQRSVSTPAHSFMES